MFCISTKSKDNDFQGGLTVESGVQSSQFLNIVLDDLILSHLIAVPTPIIELVIQLPRHISVLNRVVLPSSLPSFHQSATFIKYWIRWGLRHFVRSHTTSSIVMRSHIDRRYFVVVFHVHCIVKFLWGVLQGVVKLIWL